MDRSTDPYLAFRFAVSVEPGTLPQAGGPGARGGSEPIAVGGFNEVSGLAIETEVERRGWELLAVVSDAAVSAKRSPADRPGFSDVLEALRQIAETQGRQFQAVLDDALRDYIDRQQKERPRRHVMASFASSLDEFDSLYRELAK